MKRYDWRALSSAERAAVLARPARRDDAIVGETVARIFADVAAEGFAAVRRWAVQLDRVEPRALALDRDVVGAARARLAAEDLAALDRAVDNVRRFHAATAPGEIAFEVMAGVRCRRVWRPIPVCALYAPGGTAPLFSTLIMLAEPARAAGVPERVALTPPGPDGEAHPMMIAAGAACGLEALWLIGGAHAIAALAYGAGLPKADKIFGPGNAYVAEAKRRAAALPGGPAIDLPAGPSELLIIADASANPAFIAADLLSQAEHDADAQVLLVAASDEIIAAVEGEIAARLPLLPRAALTRRALAQARFIRARDVEEALAVANAYAPEHLSLQVAHPELALARVAHAGAVFMGAGGAEAFGDYIVGPSHVLPTDGAARAWSGLSVASFMKSFTVQEIDAAGAAALAAPAARLARAEGLEAHAQAAEARAR